MTDFPFDILSRTISETEPCGPSLEAMGDDVYMQFTARLEGQLPQSFLRFDRSQIDFKTEFATLQKLLSSSIDVSLIVLLAKLLILDRDLEGFAKALVAIRDCLCDRWEHVHPQPLDGDPIMRVISLQTLDDMPTSLMPLQAVALFKARRFGAVSYRSHLLAEGAIQQAPVSDGDEDSAKVPSPSDIRSAIAEADIETIVASRDTLAVIHKVTGEIEAAFDERSGQPGLLRFSNLKPLAESIRQFLEGCVAIKDPSLAVAPQDAMIDGEENADRAPASSGPIANLAQARAALVAAGAYFSGQEPSSPVRMILAQAEALVGKTFYEALQSMIPDHFGQAVMKLGRDLPLTISVERLSQLVPDAYQEEVPYDDGSGPDGPGHSGVAATRAEAMQLIEQVSNFFRSKEPSSPIPILLEQARQAAGRDFVGLLRDFLPGHILAVDG